MKLAIWTEAVEILQAGTENALAIADLMIHIFPMIQFFDKLTGHRQCIPSGDAERAILVSPARRIIQTAFEIGDIDLHSRFPITAGHADKLKNNGFDQRSFSAAGRAHYQEVGYLIRVPGDRSVQRFAQQDFWRRFASKGGSPSGRYAERRWRYGTRLPGLRK